MRTFDFFIAHASSDYREARALAWSLEDEQCKVFFDRADLAPGAVWPVEIRKALEESRATVVLISSSSDEAFYQHEELARAIQLARDNPRGHTVIPVLLEELPDDSPGRLYGTGILQALTATRSGGLERVSQDLIEWLNEVDQSERERPPLPAASYQAFGSALRLDRYPQWSGVLEESGRPGHVFFLLHGPRTQNVAFFVKRIQRYLDEEIQQPNGVYRVRFKWEGVAALCGADWQRHLRWALGGTGSAARCLARAARTRAVFLTLGLRPLDRLSDQQREGLREFIVETLPALVREARPRNAVRILLALDYEEAPDDGSLPPLVAAADAWGRNLRSSGELRYRRLPPVKLPRWEEVLEYLDDFAQSPDTRIVSELQKEYERLKSGGSFQELTDMLDRYLQDA